jgi:hypothetical protein
VELCLETLLLSLRTTDVYHQPRTFAEELSYILKVAVGFLQYSFELKAITVTNDMCIGKARKAQSPAAT